MDIENYIKAFFVGLLAGILLDRHYEDSRFQYSHTYYGRRYYTEKHA